MKAHRLGITLGDVTGIGPEVTLKAIEQLSGDESAQVCLIGPWDHVVHQARALGSTIRFRNLETSEIWERNPSPNPLEIGVFNVGEELPMGLPFGHVRAAEASIAGLRLGARLSLEGQLDGIVTAPVNKESILKLGLNFVGQTEFLTQLAGTAKTGMMLLGHDERGRWLRVMLATTHLPLKDVSSTLNSQRIADTIGLASLACQQLELPRARIGVCALNPHAGEGGLLGDEERTIIEPALELSRLRGVESIGPLPADTLFYQAFRGEFDVVIAMYHDQGLGPLKMIAFETGVNWTVGLPFVRTSPDHGTAYDIAGKNKANPSSMICAIRLALKLIGRKES